MPAAGRSLQRSCVAKLSTRKIGLESQKQGEVREKKHWHGMHPVLSCERSGLVAWTDADPGKGDALKLRSQQTSLLFGHSPAPTNSN